MYLVLLAFGALLGVAGLLIGASGVSVFDRSFDAALVTPGVIAATGGLILIGLGLVLRVLQRIESALAMRPMPRAVRPGEGLAPAAMPEPLPEPSRIPFPSKPDMRLPAVPPPAPVEPAEARTFEPPQLKFPTVARRETAAPVQEDKVSPPPKAQPRGDEAVAVKFRNGGGPSKVAPQLDVRTRPPAMSERAKGPAFESFWPKGPRPPRTAQPAPPPAVPMAIEPEQNAAPLIEPPLQDDLPEPLSVLKSGVVDGMAYTLFSDGSIEAQLPQGMLRFGSITELRNHIEQAPPDAAAS
jgi:hypothetical protein